MKDLPGLGLIYAIFVLALSSVSGKGQGNVNYKTPTLNDPIQHESVLISRDGYLEAEKINSRT